MTEVPILESVKKEMGAQPIRIQESLVLDCLAGGGEMGAAMRSLDWTATPLGPVTEWPQSLRTAVSILLASRYPMLILWGPDLVQLYNDAYRPVLGATKHPQALGQPGRECWPEIWDVIGPMFTQVMTQGEAIWSEDMAFFLDRYGYVEETFFTFCYSAIRDESGGVGGVLVTCVETTQRVLGERRLSTLRELAAHSSSSKTAAEASQAAIRTLAGNTKDIPFVLLYLLDPDGKRARLAAITGLARSEPITPEVVSFAEPDEWTSAWPLGEAARTGQIVVVDDLVRRFGPLPAGPWPEAPRAALILPVLAQGTTGFLIAGISARRALDDDYRGFLQLVAGHVATAISNARAYDEERRRAEALTELDRAKTAFFSNVSHEFRTPLTLLLGPLEETLARSRDWLPAQDHENLAVAHRNGLRLLRLVNTLLDFSRIEAGRVQAIYEPTELASLTVDLASVFRSATERAGLRLIVDCPPLPEPVYVDREMWEKIVLNLLSNAFKFTLQGEIEVTLRPAGRAVELRVRDTGSGIPPAEIPHLFERFHRVQGTIGRTYEGSGIGLALVQELVRLHAGSVAVESVYGKGSTFIVSIPLGPDHLAPERIGGPRSLSSTALGPGPYVEEALRWLPDQVAGDAAQLPATEELPAIRVERPAAGAGRPRILVVDDNADMRDYLRHLLRDQYDVESAPEGQAALAAARGDPPDLVLADVMMPGLDGFAMLEALRADRRTRPVPVILLSARAGEESRVEGLEKGADDYLIKPFSARELLARVAAHLEMARLRREAARRESELRAEADAARQNLETILASVSDAFLSVDRDWRVTYANHRAIEASRLDAAEPFGRSLWEMWSGWAGGEFETRLRRAMELQAPDHFEHFYGPWDRWSEIRIYPSPNGLSVFIADVTERKKADERLRQSQRELSDFLENATVGLHWVGADGRILWVNRAELDLLGYTREEFFGKHIADFHVDPSAVDDILRPPATAGNGGLYNYETRLRCKDGSIKHVLIDSNIFWKDEQPVHRRCFVRDITGRKQAEDALRESDERLRAALLASGTGTFRWNIRTNALQWDENLHRLFGVPAGRTVRRVEEFLELVDPDDRTRVMEGVDACARDGVDFDMEFRVTWPDGTVHWLADKGKTFFDALGNPLYMTGACVDITNYKRVEESLRRQNERLELLSEAAGRLLSAEDREVMVRDLFHRVSDHLGLDVYFNYMLSPAGDALRLDSWAGIPDETASEIQNLEFGRAICGTVALERRPILATHIQDSDDPKAQLVKGFGIRSYFCNPLMAGDRLLGTLSFASRRRDRFNDDELEFLRTISHYVALAKEQVRLVAELKDRASSLAESEARFRQLADAMPQIVWSARPDGVIDYYNNRWYEFSGLAEGTDKHWKSILHPDDFHRCWDRWLQAVRTGEVYQIEYRLRERKTGGYRWHLGRAFPVQSASGRIVRWFGTCTDIDNQKRAQESLKEADRRKDEFLAMLAHELRNPLAPIRNGLEVIRLQRGEATAVEQMLPLMERQIQQLIRLVDDLLDVSRITRGKIKLHKETVDLSAVFASAVESSRGLIESRRHRLSVSLPPDPVRLEADPARLAQVLANLLNNAAKYTEEGGRIWLTAARDNDYVVIKVRDSGMGIPPEMLERVFDLFIQVDRSLDRSQGGLGLGLTLVRNLTELHGGTVRAFSAGPDQGSEFVVRLPVLAADPSPGDPSNITGSAAAGTTTRRILIVDDNVDAAQSLHLLLQLTGHEVRSVHDGPQALEMARTFRPHIVLLDIGLPEMDGYEVARQLRRDPEREDTVLIALSGYGRPEDRRRSAEAGFQHHLVKPVDPGLLESLLGGIDSFSEPPPTG